MNVRLEFEDVGSERHGAVGCAAAVDAAIDVIGDGSECCAAV